MSYKVQLIDLNGIIGIFKFARVPNKDESLVMRQKEFEVIGVSLYEFRENAKFCAAVSVRRL